MPGRAPAIIYDWNLLPIGQVLWEKELTSYKKYPPLQDPESYNLGEIMEQIKKSQVLATRAMTHQANVTSRAGGPSGRPLPDDRELDCHWP